MSAEPAALGRLRERLAAIGEVAVAVSGGVDSMVLATVAHRTRGCDATMFHAVSAAVPPSATARVERHAARGGWRLAVIDAGELADARYLANPVDRCYFCKTRLYDAVAERTAATVVSGTNTDDLGDYRPGLDAAAERGVRHPYVETGIDKATVRAIARFLELDDLAELPAAPCLSSRVETGIGIRAPVLAAVDDSETLIRDAIAPATVRCRVRREAIVAELDHDALATLDAAARDRLATAIARRFAVAGVDRPVHFEAYRMGSAFVHARAAGGA